MRQTDTESVAYYFATKDANPLHPQASLIRPQTNVNGYFFLEFPAYQYLLSIFYRAFGTSVVVAHLFNLGIFTLSFWLLYTFAARFFSPKMALWTTVLYSFVPSSLFFFGHAIHPDLFAITCVLLTLSLLTQTTRSPWKIIAAGLVMGIAVGTRPFILMALPSLFIVSYFQKAKWWEYPILLSLSIAIYGLWTWWQTLFPEADHSWQYWTLQGREVLYTFAGVKFLVWRNVSGEVVGRIATILAILGVFSLLISFFRKLMSPLSISEKFQLIYHRLFKTISNTPQTIRLFLFSFTWLAAVPVYWFIAPAGNAAHQYYANVFLIPIIFLAAWGAHRISERFTSVPIKVTVSTLILVALIYNGLRTSSYFYNNIIPAHHLEIAKEIEKTIPVNSKIVYLAENNSVPFSLVHRQGWMLGAPPTDVDKTAQGVLKMKEYGAQYAVWATKNNDFSEEEIKKLEKETQKIYQSDVITLYQL